MHHPFLKHLAFIFSILIITSLACATTAPTANAETGYRYDNLPDAGDEDEGISKYRAISQWGKTNLTYYFINETGKISGKAERDLIRAAFKLWADETPLSL